MTSSDEDLDSLRVSEDGRYVNTFALQCSAERLKSIRAKEISSASQNHSDHIYAMAAESEYSSESYDISENKLCIYESESFKKFLSVVLPAEPNEMDRARIAKKLNKYCELADPRYLRSPEFDEVLEQGSEKIIEDPIYLYFVLKDVKDCLLSNKVECKTVENTDDEMLSSGEDDSEIPPQGNTLESDNLKDVNREERKHKIVNKLTSLLKKVDDKIKELEELEVDFSDEEDSSYIKMQRYRERFCEVYEKLCKYTNKPLNGNRVGGVRKINFSDTNNLEMNRAIEKWLNKTMQFPDFSDVNNFMIELNQSLNLNLTEEQITTKAQQIFENIGNMLQRRRHFDLWDSLSSFLNTEVDPAVRNPELESVLKMNYDLGIEKEKELLRHYAERQEREQLQPREVPDEEANCSPDESDDEDEEEIGTVGNMSNSKKPTDDDEYGYGSDGIGNDESDHNSFRFPDSETRNPGPSKMVVKRKTRVENNDRQSISVSMIDDAGSRGIDSHTYVNSENTEIVGTNIGTIPVSDEITVSAIPNEQDTEDNLVVCKSENFMKRKNENLNENDNDNINIHPCKKFLEGKEMTETKNFEKTESINKSDSDSDCEIIEIVSNKGGETSKALSLKRNVDQVNYAFTNNNFNHNTVLPNNALNKRHCLRSNYKNVKNQKPSNDNPPDESTNTKSTANKNALQRENKVKRKPKNTVSKPKSLNSVTSSKDSDLKNNDLATSTDTNSINCSLQQEKSGENMKSQKEVNKTNQNNDVQEDSNNETAAPPNGGSSGDGNGQDNSENNGNKKPSDRDTQTEDNEENEDKEEDEEEDADTPEKKQPETPKAIEAVPKLILSRTNQKGQKVSGAAVFKPPPPKKVAPVRRNSSGKQAEKPPGNETTQRKQPLNSTPTARSPRARAPAVRKKKTNQNAGTQGTPREGKSNVFTFHFQKGPAELKKRNVNKATPTASKPSKDNDVEIIQVTKKQRPTPVKPVQSDEEIVKNFLERSHPSISITTPKKKAVQNEPSPSVRQALETLSRLKGISATIVKGSSKPKSDEEVTIISESLNPRVSKISKQQKTPTPSATATKPPPVATATMRTPVATATMRTPVATATMRTPVATATMRTPVATATMRTPVATATMPTPVATATMPTPVATATMPAPVATATMPAPVATATMLTPVATATMPTPVATATMLTPVATATSLEPLLPKIVTVQGNVIGFEDMVDDSTVIQDNLHQNYVQTPQASLVNVSGIKTNYNENFYNSQVSLVHVSGIKTNYNENFYNSQAHVANASASTGNYNEHFYSLQAPVATVPGSASTFQEDLYGPQESAADTSGSASTYEENFTGTLECVPIPRFRNVRSRSRRTPKPNQEEKTNDIEYVILD